MSTAHTRVPLWLVALLCLMAFAFQGTRGIWEPDEGRYSSAGINMHESGDWLIPTIDGEHPHLTKPPMTYWALAASFAALGHNEWAARLPGALAYIGTGLFVFGLGRRLCPRRPWLPALVWGLSFAPAIAANIVSTDPLLVAVRDGRDVRVRRGLVTGRRRRAALVRAHVAGLGPGLHDQGTRRACCRCFAMMLLPGRPRSPALQVDVRARRARCCSSSSRSPGSASWSPSNPTGSATSSATRSTTASSPPSTTAIRSGTGRSRSTCRCSRRHAAVVGARARSRPAARRPPGARSAARLRERDRDWLLLALLAAAAARDILPRPFAPAALRAAAVRAARADDGARARAAGAWLEGRRVAWTVGHHACRAGRAQGCAGVLAHRPRSRATSPPQSRRSAAGTHAVDEHHVRRHAPVLRPERLPATAPIEGIEIDERRFDYSKYVTAGTSAPRSATNER